MNKILFALSYSLGVLFSNLATIISLAGIFAFAISGSARYLMVTVAGAILVLSFKIENDV